MPRVRKTAYRGRLGASPLRGSRSSDERSLEVSFELSFQRSFDASFRWNFEASHVSSNALSIETSDARSDEASTEMSDGVSFRVSVLRCFPVNSGPSFLASFPASFRRSSELPVCGSERQGIKGSRDRG